MGMIGGYCAYVLCGILHIMSDCRYGWYCFLHAPCCCFSNLCLSFGSVPGGVCLFYRHFLLRGLRSPSACCCFLLQQSNVQWYFSRNVCMKPCVIWGFRCRVIRLSCLWLRMPLYMCNCVWHSFWLWFFAEFFIRETGKTGKWKNEIKG